MYVSDKDDVYNRDVDSVEDQLNRIVCVTLLINKSKMLDQMMLMKCEELKLIINLL